MMASQSVHRRPPLTVDGRAPMRSRSATSTSAHTRPRPQSRESTTSEQSTDVNNALQYRAEHVPGPQPGLYMVQTDSLGQRLFQHNAEEMLMQYGHQMVQGTPYGLDPNMAAVQHQHEIRPTSQHGFHNAEVHRYAMMQGYPHGMPQYALPHTSLHNPSHPARNLDGLENQSPAPEDSENPDSSGKRKKGAATSLANDAELRRLLKQYQGKTLKEVANEVQRKEGGEGKSEKAKQVFAMLWLQENCKRSSNDSVRRDRVFSRYTERCGNERVPTLNPASFGKLVRIIFPNVQTRRLGVRGESKYHYVDLQLNPKDERQTQSQDSATVLTRRDSHAEVDTAARFGSTEDHLEHKQRQSRSQSFHDQVPTDTADFPSPTKSFPPRAVDPSQQDKTVAQPATIPAPQALKMDCQYLNAPTIRINTATMSSSLVSVLPAVRNSLPGTLWTYQGLPGSSSLSSSSPPNSQTDLPIELPDIHGYLVNTNYDKDIANSLSHLYRSYCIVVIDSFRYCKEKPFFHHHSAFNGTMTVPVAKLLANERLSPWIHECDMRMYKRIIRYIAQLVTQVVPEHVWGVFERVSNRLVPHLVSAFEEKCPTHVVMAKVVPATRFCNLLKRLRSANTAANHVAAMLQDERGRTQMWLDLMACVDPHRVVEESMPPVESWSKVEDIFRIDMKRLICPIEDDFVTSIEREPSNPFSALLSAKNGAPLDDHSPSSGEENMHGPLDRWVSWLENLPSKFPSHYPQCLVNWHNGFWKSVMTQMGIGGAQSYQSWWYLEAFLSNTLNWLTQMEGLLMDESQQQAVDQRELRKKKDDENWDLMALQSKVRGSNADAAKRKRTEDDDGGEERSASRASHISIHNDAHQDDGSQPRTAVTDRHIGLDGATDDHDDELEELSNAAPLDLPSIDGRSPEKAPRLVVRRHHQAHDDSGISLDIEIEEGSAADEDQLKAMRKEWGILSDPADADGHVVVI